LDLGWKLHGPPGNPHST